MGLWMFIAVIISQNKSTIDLITQFMSYARSRSFNGALSASRRVETGWKTDSFALKLERGTGYGAIDVIIFTQSNYTAILRPRRMVKKHIKPRAGSRLAPSQWETSLQSTTVSHWRGTSLESTLNPLYSAGPYMHSMYDHDGVIWRSWRLKSPTTHWMFKPCPGLQQSKHQFFLLTLLWGKSTGGNH